MTKVGSSKRLNLVKGVGNAIVSNNTELSNHNQPIVSGSLIYNKDTRELKVSDGTTPPSALFDHRHPDTHAPLIHSHMFGTNDPWLMSMPKLMYIDDIKNHPELIVMDGSEITDDRAEFISKIYPGTKLLTNKLENLTGEGFENDELTMSISSFDGIFTGDKLFGEAIELKDIVKVTDQWLSTSTDLNDEQYISISFKGNHAYRPTEYWVCPAFGTAEEIFKNRPTPQEWFFEGSIDGITWETIDSKSNELAENWSVLETRIFKVSPTVSYSHLRLRITKWNAGQETNMNTGLKRLWVFGRKRNVFSLPLLESPHPDFAWVIPQNNLNVGLKHEDIGDIGTSCMAENLLPSYRLPTNGKSYKKTNHSPLFAVIGHRYDTEATLVNSTASDGTIEGTSWQAGFTDPHLASYIEFDLSTPSMLGRYFLDMSGMRTPVSFVVEGLVGDTWSMLQSVMDISKEDFISTGGFFSIDTTIADIPCSKIRINFLEWEKADTPIGLVSAKFFTHMVGEFFVPTYHTDNVTTYIVADNTVDDVSTKVIQRLQANMIDLANGLAEVNNKLIDINPEIVKPSGE